MAAKSNRENAKYYAKCMRLNLRKIRNGTFERKNKRRKKRKSQRVTTIRILF